MRILAQSLIEGEKELMANIHEDPKVFKNDPGGICYRRDYTTHDIMFDSYHPWERAQMMEFYDNREKLKAEYDDYFKNSLSKKYKPEPQIV